MTKANENQRGWQAQVLTLFPEMFPGPLGYSLAGKALESGLWALETVDIRDYAHDKHRTIDDSPAGGGSGMVMRVDILAEAIDKTREKAQESWPLIYLSPRGKPFNQAKARELKDRGGATLICGRFEGIDERVITTRKIEEISLGDFILSGGEVAALALIDSVVRLIPGVVGNDATHEEESFEKGLLEYPHYTRPNVFEGHEIPEILTSGNHGKIREWRLEQSKELTRLRRPDLWQQYCEKKSD